MATCNWKPREKKSYLFGDGYECREAPWRDGVCIFHVPRGEKTREVFEEALLSKIEREESDEKVAFHDLRGYVFPDGFSAFLGTSPGEGKEFRKRVRFSFAKFGNEANFAGAKFGDKADFLFVTFGNEANFWGATFGDRASFWGATFGDKAFFAGATFGDEADFASAKFGDEASFWGTTFGDKARFVSATSGDKAHFASATFGGEANFLDAKFGNKADFSRAKFGEEAGFANATFGGKAGFVAVTFGDKADFLRATFGDEAGFADAAFGDKAKFFGTKFRNEADFFDAKFGNEASFMNATFGDKARFLLAKFGNKAGFSSAKFGNEADFTGATFGEVASFAGATFQGSVRFEGRDKDESGKRVFEGSVDFRRATFAEPHKVRFHSVNLSEALLTGTGGLDAIQFIDVDWVAEPKRFDVFKNFFRRLGKGNLREAWKLYRREHAACGRGRLLYDEFSLESNTALVAEAYRGLQKNYENKRYYRLSDDFYTGAMEMERRQRPIWKRWPYTLYRFISLYGQDWWRPLWLAIGALMLATLTFWWTGFTVRNNTEVLPFVDHSTIASALLALGDAFLHSFSVVTFQRMHYGQDSDSRLFYVATYLEAIFVPVLVAFFLFALRRRFRR